MTADDLASLAARAYLEAWGKHRHHLRQFEPGEGSGRACDVDEFARDYPLQRRRQSAGPRPDAPSTRRAETGQTDDHAKNEAGTTGTLILMGDLQPVLRKLGGRKCPRPTRDRWASRLLPSAA
jgi:hypothetical protein